ncbi:MAG TPA: TetR/AcrR family transcriptional regulator [Polyangiaceae bacterium]|nr:TetR/AcrR family transcriptional regulator [Polyangiaceae bacterium]
MAIPSRPAAKSKPKQAVAPARPFVRGLADTRALLVTAARDLFLEAGEPGFSLREVARRVGVSPAAVYRHFEGKEALIFAACTQGFEVFSSYLVRALAGTTPLERALAACEQYRLFGLENPLDYRFIFMSPAKQIQPSKTATPARNEPMLPQYSTFQFLVDRIRECMEAGVIARGDTQQTAVLVWAHLHGLVSLRLAGLLDAVGDEQAFSDMYRLSASRLFRALS